VAHASRDVLGDLLVEVKLNFVVQSLGTAAAAKKSL
jgi:hypothetical protein